MFLEINTHEEKGSTRFWPSRTQITFSAYTYPFLHPLPFVFSHFSQNLDSDFPELLEVKYIRQ